MSFIKKIFNRSAKEDIPEDNSKKHEAQEKVNVIKGEICACKGARNWSSLGRLYLDKGKAYQRLDNDQKSLECYLTAYYIELNGGSDKVGTNEFDSLFSEFEPEKPEESTSRNLLLDLVKRKKVQLKFLVSNCSAPIDELHSEYGFPVSGEDFFVMVESDL